MVGIIVWLWQILLAQISRVTCKTYLMDGKTFDSMEHSILQERYSIDQVLTESRPHQLLLTVSSNLTQTNHDKAFIPSFAFSCRYWLESFRNMNLDWNDADVKGNDHMIFTEPKSMYCIVKETVACSTAVISLTYMYYPNEESDRKNKTHLAVVALLISMRLGAERLRIWGMHLLRHVDKLVVVFLHVRTRIHTTTHHSLTLNVDLLTHKMRPQIEDNEYLFTDEVQHQFSGRMKH